MIAVNNIKNYAAANEYHFSQLGIHVYLTKTTKAFRAPIASTTSNKLDEHVFSIVYLIDLELKTILGKCVDKDFTTPVPIPLDLARAFILDLDAVKLKKAEF